MKTLKLNENQIFEFELLVKNGHGEMVPVEVCEEESKENFYVFRSQNQIYNVNVKVELVRKENSTYIRMCGDIKAPSAWEKCHHFALYEAIVLKLYPVKDAERIFGSCYCVGNDSDCWVAPYFCNSFSEVKRSVSLLWQNEDIYYHMMPLCDGDFKAEIKNIDKCLAITAAPFCGGYNHIDCKCVVCTWGNDPYKVCEENVAFGFETLGKKNSMRKNTRLSDVFNYLGWCSWDSMHLNVSAEKFYEKAAELKEKNIPVKWMLVDDGWFQGSETPPRELIDFREEKEKFPEGLKEFVNRMKSEYGMKYMGIWEASLGGWCGIKADSPMLIKIPDRITRLPNSKIIPRTDEMGSFGFWNYVNEYLSNCGFDFLKVDVEYSVEAASSGYMPVGAVAKGSHYGMEGSVGLHFDGACINCTGMGHELLWNSPVGMVNRNSEDFIPTKPETMRAFVTANVYNSFYHSKFYHTDWDMMWSKSETYKMNAVMHAISGAPIYISDLLGLSERENIMPLCLDTGELLKCDDYAVPTEDRLFVNPMTENVALKAYNIVKESGVIGVINVDAENRTVRDSFKASDIHNINGDQFVIFDWFGKTAEISDLDGEHKVELAPYDAELYIVSPVMDGIAVIGDIDKFISPAIVESRADSGTSHMFILKQGSKFAFYTEKAFEVYVNNKKADVIEADNYYVVDCTDISGKVFVTIEIM